MDIEETNKGKARATKEGKVCGDDKVVAETARSGAANIENYGGDIRKDGSFVVIDVHPPW